MRSIQQNDDSATAKRSYNAAVAELHANGAELFSIRPQELDRALSQVPRPSHGDCWGSWQFDGIHFTLGFRPEDNRPGSGWFVNLKKLTSAQSVYETILRVQAKRYINAEDVGNFLAALHDLGLTISSSRPTPFDPVGHLKSLTSRRFREN